MLEKITRKGVNPFSLQDRIVIPKEVGREWEQEVLEKLRPKLEEMERRRRVSNIVFVACPVDRGYAASFYQQLN